MEEAKTYVDNQLEDVSGINDLNSAIADIYDFLVSSQEQGYNIVFKVIYCDPYFDNGILHRAVYLSINLDGHYYVNYVTMATAEPQEHPDTNCDTFQINNNVPNDVQFDYVVPFIAYEYESVQSLENSTELFQSVKDLLINYNLKILI